MYEIEFQYQKKEEDGELSDVETAKVKIGKPDEEVNLGSVAATIFGRFARRNTIVTDVKIFEFKRKQIAFRETDEGLVISGRKFRFDNCLNVEAEIPVVETGPKVFPHENLKKPVQSTPSAPAPSAPTPKPVKYEVFDPQDELMSIAQEQKIPLTPGKKYPVLVEKAAGNVTDGILYEVVDDKGNKRVISERYFRPQPAPLIGDFVEDQSHVLGDTGKEPNLSFQNAGREDMPAIRK